MIERVGLAVALAALLGGFVACGGQGAHAPRGSTSAGTRSPAESAPAEALAPPTPLPKKLATLYFPSSSSGLLVAEPREILLTPNAGDLAKQILSDLLSGPTQEGLGAAVPVGTRLLQVYIVRDGTAYADFSSELQSAIAPGSDTEIATVYSIVNSLTANIPVIDRVGILIDGRPCASLNGHMDLRHPLRPDWKAVESGAPDATPASPRV